jgi:hypothetical protein
LQGINTVIFNQPFVTRDYLGQGEDMASRRLLKDQIFCAHVEQIARKTLLWRAEARRIALLILFCLSTIN